MDINVSQLIAFQRCELDWYYAHVLRRVRRGWSVPFKVGEWWHLLMSHYFANYSHSDAKSLALIQGIADMVAMKQDALEEGYPDEAADFWADCNRLLTLFEHHFTLAYPPDHISMIEQPLRRALPNSHHSLIGIPDAVVTISGQRWHLQHKTASDRTHMRTFIDASQRSMHELVYAWLLDEGSLEDTIPVLPYGGTYMNIVRKINAKTLASQPTSAFVQELIPLSREQIQLAIVDATRLIERMEAIASGYVHPIDNRDADTNSFRNALSPYFWVKLGKESIDDDSIFTHNPSRYDEEPSNVRPDETPF